MEADAKREKSSSSASSARTKVKTIVSTVQIICSRCPPSIDGEAVGPADAHGQRLCGVTRADACTLTLTLSVSCPQLQRV